MNSYIVTNLVYNELEYFCYLNHWLLFLFFFIVTFYSILKITTPYFNKIYYNDTFIEFVCTLFSLMFLLFIISPALIILLDIDSIIMPSFIIWSLGYQWAWTYNITYLNNNIGYTSYNDHYIMSSYFYTINIPIINSTICIPELLFINYYSIFSYLNQHYYSIFSYFYSSYYSFDNTFNDNSFSFNRNLLSINNYLFEVNTYLVIPLWSCIKIYVFSLDVVHPLSFYSFGIKIDAIPGRINLTSSLRSFIKGVNRGFCYELCGEQHNTMLNTWINM